jgi:hypothetical protein
MIGINTSMKKFIPTYLYVKTHNITGLKYFGKTTGDPFKYRGSGIYWLRHLKEHGYDVRTDVIGYYTLQEECMSTATQFSKDNDIVHAVNENNKKIWANQIIENGIDGGATGRTIYNSHSEESKEKMSVSRKGSIPWNKGKTGVTPGNKTPRSDENKQRLREANLGKKQSQETIDKRIEKLKGHIVTEETRLKISAGHKGKKLSFDHIQKIKNRVVSNITKQKIKEARKKQTFSEETKKKLSGKVIVVDVNGDTKKILKEEYYSQPGHRDTWKYVAHNSNEGKKRKMRRG